MKEYIVLLVYELFFYLIGLYNRYRGHTVCIHGKLCKIVFLNLNERINKGSVLGIMMCASMEIMALITVLFALVIAPNSIYYYRDLIYLMLASLFLSGGMSCVDYVRYDAQKELDKILVTIYSVIFAVFSILLFIVAVVDIIKKATIF